jgi:hypothetical protein
MSLLEEEKAEVRRIREALLPPGYWVYGVGKPAMGNGRIEIHARVPEDEADWKRLEAIQQRRVEWASGILLTRGRLLQLRYKRGVRSRMSGVRRSRPRL